jgi:uncharacterized protein YdbL (DUF1318 family)
MDLDPSEYTIDGLRDELDGIDDPEALEAIREAESDGESRAGAIETIDERLESVSGDESDGSEETDENSSENGQEGGSDGTGVGIVEVRNRVRDAAGDLIGRALDGIVEIERSDGEWRALVEIIERRSVPDTQDIIGRYALDLDDEGRITGYRRLERYRRGDTRRDEEAPASGR